MPKFSLEKARASADKVNAAIREKVMSNPETRALYERRRREIELALAMRDAREKAKLSQEDIAKRMQTTRSAVSRLESSGASRHSPSIDTLLKYAQAIGYELKINFVQSEGIS